MPIGTRVRSNNAYGVTTDNPLTAGAATFNSTQLILLPAITSPNQHTVIVLDPKRVFGQPEIVIVTAHTSLSTTATITRGAYGTVAASHAVGTAWAHVAVSEDYIQVLTSATRPTDPYIGQSIYETDTQSTKTYNGTIWNSSPPVGSLLPYAGSTAPTGYLLADGTAVSRTTYADLFGVVSTTYGGGDGSTTFNLPDLRSRVPVGRDAAAAEFDVLGETGGEKTHLLVSGEMPSHTHGITDAGHNHSQNAHNHTQDAHSHDDGSYSTGGETGHTHHSPGNNFVFERGAVEAQRIPDSGSTSNGVYVTYSPNTLGSSGHTHDVQGSSGGTTATNQAATASNNAATTGITANSAGSSAAHNNLQPYLTINYIVKI